MALIPFSYNNPYTLRLEERLFDIHHPLHVNSHNDTTETSTTTTTLRIKQDYKEDGKGGTKLGFGASVYNSAVALAKYIEQNAYLIRDKRVLELGAGLGMTSIAASLLGASSVIITDGDDELLNGKTKENVTLNLGEKSLQDGRIQVARLYWGEEEDISPFRHNQDIVIAADVAALPYEHAYTDLLHTCRELCLPHSSDTQSPDMLLAYRRRHYTEIQFFEQLEKSFHIERVPQESMHEDFRDGTIDIMQCWLKRQDDSSS